MILNLARGILLNDIFKILLVTFILFHLLLAALYLILCLILHPVF